MRRCEFEFDFGFDFDFDFAFAFVCVFAFDFEEEVVVVVLGVVVLIEEGLCFLDGAEDEVDEVASFRFLEGWARVCFDMIMRDEEATRIGRGKERKRSVWRRAQKSRRPGDHMSAYCKVRMRNMWATATVISIPPGPSPTSNAQYFTCSDNNQLSV